jgi:nicotinic acid mononucleotide adenylyltransferase
MLRMDINDFWYRELEEYHGHDFCIEAGYFKENQPWGDCHYRHVNFLLAFLPHDEPIIQYSGAFHPIHDGHVSCIKLAIDAIVERTNATHGTVVLHVDHGEYRQSKGYFPADLWYSLIADFINLFEYKGFRATVVFEDNMMFGCSRNFTRLYSELLSLGNDVYFLSGGDRANYALTFVHKGKCIIAGRSLSENFQKYRSLESDRIWFLEGNNPASSTEIRKNLDI